MTATRLIDVIGPPTPEQARRILLLLGLAGGAARNENGSGAVTPEPQIKTVHQQAS